MSATAEASGELVHIAVTCNEAYARPLAAMLASLEARLDERCGLVIHALLVDFSEQNWTRLLRSVPRRRVHWNRIEFQVAALAAHGISTRDYEHFSTITFLRLLLPELLSPKVHKVLYLDSDLIICADIAQLWRTDIGDVPLAAAVEWNPAAREAGAAAGIRLFRDLAIPAHRLMFNSGVLLLNLSCWRRLRLAQRAFVYLRAVGPDVRWYDQEALNVVVGGAYRALDARWNVPADIASSLPPEQVWILHYLTAKKPWHWQRHPLNVNPFFEALDRTAWSQWRPTAPRLGIVREFAARLRKALNKRLWIVRASARHLGQRVEYWRARPRNLTPSAAARRTDRKEIRLFLHAAQLDEALLATLQAYFAAGAQRALVLLDRDTDTAIPASYAASVHLFLRGKHDRDLALRRLLQRYGQGCWCILGRVSEMIVDESGSPIRFQQLCRELEATGDQSLSVTQGAGEPLELTARDARTHTIFCAMAQVAASERAYTAPVFLSRVAVLEYSRHVLMDRGANFVGNLRHSARYLHSRSLQPDDACLESPGLAQARDV